MSFSAIDYCDIQGLARFGFGHLKDTCFLLLKIENPAAARRWLKAAPVASAEKLASPPATALQVAFTSQGLQTLGVPPEVISGFSDEFISGMSGEESRSRRLGDVGANSPSGWEWGGPGNMPHVLLMLYAERGRLEAWKERLLEELAGAGCSLLRCLPTSDLRGHEHFGFRDGISQPRVDWDGERRADGGDQLEYANLVAVGEFLLGYPNEYGKYTDRPLVKQVDGPAAELAAAADRPGLKDVGRNGAYLIFRHLEQDVRGFWQFLDGQAKAEPEVRRKLAEAMVGRTMDGVPLVPQTSHPIRGVGPDPDEVRLNQFTYEADGGGTRCPIGAHIRRSNPRNADLPPGARGFFSRLKRTLGFGRRGVRDDLVASTRFHRLLRRGREYGRGLSPEESIRAGGPDGEERGLYFICLSASIARQFEFVQNAWVAGSKFDGLTEESDPLLGNRLPGPGCPFTDGFSLAREGGVRQRLKGLPQFVTVRGGAYFFLPGLRALRYLASFGD